MAQNGDLIRGYVLNRAERAMSFLQNRKSDPTVANWNDLDRVQQTLLELYHEATQNSDVIPLLAAEMDLEAKLTLKDM